MSCIQHSCIGTPTHLNKAIAGLTSILAITVIALSIIGLTATSSGPFNAIVQFGRSTNGALLGTSIFVLILDLVWIAALCKKKKEPIDERGVLGKMDPAAILPQEISLTIFSYLNAYELGRNCLVSKKWCTLSSNSTLWNAIDLRKISPLLRVFDESDWITHVDLSKYGLSINDAPPLDKRKVIPEIMKCLASLDIEGNAGITLLTIPKFISLNKLEKLVESPKKGNTTQFRYFFDDISNQVGDIQVDKTYRILITNNIFNRSRKISFSAQKELLKINGCEMIKVIEATVLLVVTSMGSGVRLYNDNPCTYTLCSTPIADDHCLVGDNDPDGFRIDDYVDFINDDSDEEAAVGVFDDTDALFDDEVGIGGVYLTEVLGH